MRECCFTVECNSKTHTVIHRIREFKYLVGKQCPEGGEFIQSLGMWDNFSVSKGQNTEAWTSKPRLRLLEATEKLLARVQQDRDYIGYAYQYGFTSEPKTRHSARGSGVRLPGRDASISLHPGQIYLEPLELGSDGKWHVVDTIDLRRSGPILTESVGLLKIYRRRSPINWEQKLPALIDFLKHCTSENVRIRHHYTAPSKSSA